MTYQVLRLAHIIGAIVIGAGLIGVWLSDLRARQVRDLPRFGEAIRYTYVYYYGLVFPGALVLLTSGTWLIVALYGGWSFEFLKIPWLAGMVVLFVFEFIEGNTVTRVYFSRLRRLTLEAEAAGRVSGELQRTRSEIVPTFTHFLDLPLLLVIVSLGATRPGTWTLFFVGTVVTVALAVALTMALSRLFPGLPTVSAVTSGAAQPGVGTDDLSAKPPVSSRIRSRRRFPTRLTRAASSGM